jgi:cyclase
MFRPRVIPVLLLKARGLVKSVRFKNHRYVGDPINAVRIFNELKADELVFLDIEASRNNRLISLELVRRIGEEAFMPFSVGGGIRSLADIELILAAGAEKVVINTYAGQDPNFVKKASEAFGSSTIVICIDVKTKLFRGARTWILNGTRSTEFTPLEFARLVEDMGAGELIVQSIERDGMMAGYATDLIRSISAEVGIPVIALGGAGSLNDLTDGFRKGQASAVAAGSVFVYQDKRRGVLINYPERKEFNFE